MRIGKLNKFSTTDYPGMMSCVLYTAGCNFDCWWCPDPALIPSDCPEVPIEEVMDFLKRRYGMIEAVVISGGEPTLQPDLGEFIRTCRHIGYEVMLRTNGSNPRAVATILTERLLNAAQVDFKGPVAQYPQLCAFHGEAVLETIEALRRARLPFDVRTVVRPDMSEQDIEKMSEEVGVVPSWILRPYSPDEADPQDVARSGELLPRFKEILERTQPKVTIAKK